MSSKKTIDMKTKEKLKKEIGKLHYNEHCEIFNIIRQDTDKISENKNGVFINLKYVNDNTINKIQEFIDFCKKNKNLLKKKQQEHDKELKTVNKSSNTQNKTSLNEKYDLFTSDIIISKESENYLKVLGAKNIKNYGNLKFSNIINKQTKKLDNNLLNKIEKRKIWCAASTHPSEEILCVNSHLQIKKKINNILTIIIPRHIERVEKIKNELKIFNLKIILSSDIDQMDDKTDILLVNSYGETLKYFNISKYVFLGKSLVKSLIKDGGQNPIEAARLGCKVFHGPYVSNFVETYEYLEKLGVSKKINNFEELSASITEELKEEKPKNYDAGKKIDNYGQDIMNNIIMELKKHINY